MNKFALAMLSLGALLSFSGCPKPADGSPEEARTVLLESFATADADGDGALTFSEAVSAYPHFTEDILAKLDSSGDGLLSYGELAGTVEPGCEVTLGSVPLPVPSTGGTVSLAVHTACDWTAQCDADWISFASNGAGDGDGTLQIVAAKNTGPERSAEIHVNEAHATITQAGGCEYDVNAAPVEVPAPGDVVSWTLVAGAGCPWTVREYVGWLSPLTPIEGAGPATIQFEAAANTGVARQAVVEIAGVRITVHQASGCAVTLPHAQVHFDASGGGVKLDATTPRICEWTPSTDSDWIEVTGSVGTSGIGWLGVKVDENHGAARTGQVFAGQTTLVVEQDSGCQLTLLPVGRDVPQEGGAITFDILTEPACGWTAVSQAEWIVLTSLSDGMGNATISLTVSPNNGATRRGSVSVGDKEFSVLQTGFCTYAFSPSDVRFLDGYGIGMMHIGCPEICSWTAAPFVDWITFLEDAEGTGSGGKMYEVAKGDGTTQTGIVFAGEDPMSVTRTMEQEEAYKALLHVPEKLEVSLQQETLLAMQVETTSSGLNDLVLDLVYPEHWTYRFIQSDIPPDRVLDFPDSHRQILYWSAPPQGAFPIEIGLTAAPSSEGAGDFMSSLSVRENTNVRCLSHKTRLCGPAKVALAHSLVSPDYVPGARKDVILTISGLDSIDAFTIQETFPPTWTLEFIFDLYQECQAIVSEENHSFILTSNDPIPLPWQIVYRVHSNADESDDAIFSGNLLYTTASGVDYQTADSYVKATLKANYVLCAAPVGGIPLDQTYGYPFCYALWNIANRRVDDRVDYDEFYWTAPTFDIDWLFNMVYTGTGHSEYISVDDIWLVATFVQHIYDDMGIAAECDDTGIVKEGDDTNMAEDGIMCFQESMYILTYEEFCSMDRNGDGVVDGGDFDIMK